MYTIVSRWAICLSCGLTHKIRNSFRTSGAGQLAGNGKTSLLIGLRVPISWRTTEKSVIKGRCHLLRQKNLPFKFVYRDENNLSDHTAVRFHSHNFLHFTGVLPRQIPNSVLSEDIRSIVPKPPGKIYAIFKKPINATKYTHLTYKSKNITITPKRLPKELLKEIDFSLLEDTTESNSTEQA